MRLSDLLGRPVYEDGGERLGRVVDVRFVLDGPPAGGGVGALSEARLLGLIVSPRTSSAFAGYERTGAGRPWLIARFLAWRQRHAVFVLWSDVVAVGDELCVRGGAIRYSPALA